MNLDQTDPGEQWRDLTEHYARLSDDGLRAAGDEAYNLTEIARSVLRGEIKSRSLDIQLKEAYQPPQGDLDPADLEPELVVLRQVWSEDEARGAKEALDAAFIPSCFGRDNVERVSEIKTPYDEGVDVKVWEPHHQRALWALRSAPKQDEEPAEYKAECPNCHSPDIVFCGLDGEPQIDGSVAHSPFNWRCEACGNQWKDDGVEESRSSTSGS